MRRQLNSRLLLLGALFNVGGCCHLFYSDLLLNLQNTYQSRLISVIWRPSRLLAQNPLFVNLSEYLSNTFHIVDLVALAPPGPDFLFWHPPANPTEYLSNTFHIVDLAALAPPGPDPSILTPSREPYKIPIKFVSYR